jgi:hypothetical protein
LKPSFLVEVSFVEYASLLWAIAFVTHLFLHFFSFRFYQQSNFDTALRTFCKEHGITYQSFWTLTANRRALASATVHEWATRLDLTPQQLMFAFLMSLGYITPLSGTTTLKHMTQDVAIMERIQGGEQFFTDQDQLRDFAHLLGMPML